MAKETNEAAAAEGEGSAPRIDWDDTAMKSSYANVCNVQGTREEFVLLFGISHPSQSGGPQVKVRLSDRRVRISFAGLPDLARAHLPHRIRDEGLPVLRDHDHIHAGIDGRRA